MTKDESSKKQIITKIKHGTVIDHLDADTVFKIVRILNLEKCTDQVTIGVNMRSSQINRKGIIKIENMFLSKEDVDKISLFSPHATINLIKDYEVDQKFEVEIPQKVSNVLKCNNPKCVTNLENERTLFILHKKSPLEFICKFCERRLLKNDLEVI
ncbi:MAG: aspartate carbamoyltransferase regulatory subunit [bacterium]